MVHIDFANSNIYRHDNIGNRRDVCGNVEGKIIAINLTDIILANVSDTQPVDASNNYGSASRATGGLFESANSVIT